MKHAGEQAVNSIEHIIARIRELPGLTERKRGTFYRKSDAFLHFHEDPAGMFADLKCDGDFVRYRVSTAKEIAAFVRDAKKALES
jgi:hypothetical protein